ncbi:MAG: DUF2851 family protein [Rikenellaceae bacterium]|nr:DUF2851 family protein [Rikenellaceae bacterium]
MIWPLQAGRRFTSDMDETVDVMRTGEYDPVTELSAGAEIVVDGVVFRGNVVFGAPGGSNSGAARRLENCILQVVAPDETTHVLKDDGTFLPQITLDAGAVTQTAYEMLRSGARGFGCAGHIGRMADHERVALFTRLLADRLSRKCGDVQAIYEGCGQSWNETMYVMLLRTMGDMRNKEAFTELARRVRYGYIARERNSQECVEALLLGASSLLDIYEEDNYTRTLRTHFDYLRRKYAITAMMPREWTVSHNNPNNHPVIRIAQTAAFLSTREFLFENVIKCRTVEDIQSLFRAEASDYWSSHYVPSSYHADRRPKRIGHFKANMLGINLAVPMMFSYGSYMNDETLKDTALELLEKIVCEDNSIVNGWRAGGVRMESAFDSQAVLQLNNEFCLRDLCHRCTIGRRVIREVYANEHK